MTKEEMKELKNLLIFMDLTINSEKGLNANGFMALWTINEQYPDFANPKKRFERISYFIEKLEEEE